MKREKLIKKIVRMEREEEDIWVVMNVGCSGVVGL